MKAPTTIASVPGTSRRDCSHHDAGDHEHAERHRGQAGQAPGAAEPGDREADEPEPDRREREQAGQDGEQLAALGADARRRRAGGDDPAEERGCDAQLTRPRLSLRRYRVPQA